MILNGVSHGSGGRNGARASASLVAAELDFLDLLFTRHSKAPNSWAHRRWVCGRFVDGTSRREEIDRGDNDEESWDVLIGWARRELGVCARVAERFPKNYYAWTHRGYVARAVARKGVSSGEDGAIDRDRTKDVVDFLSGEISFAERWLREHVSDHSSAHHGSEVLRLLLSLGTQSPCGEMVASEPFQTWEVSEARRAFANSRNLSQMFPAHEAIWIWRRFCGVHFLWTTARDSRSNGKKELGRSQFISITNI